MNDDFDRLLTKSLQGENPPADFADRVLAQLPDTRRAVPRPRGWRHSARRWLPLGLAAAALVGAFVQQRVEARRQVADAQQAKSQLLLALRITGTQLDRTTRRLHGSVGDPQ